MATGRPGGNTRAKIPAPQIPQTQPKLTLPERRRNLRRSNDPATRRGVPPAIQTNAHARLIDPSPGLAPLACDPPPS
eukprot:10661931-Lingulodinium_polyedra.AAC.1